MRVRGLILVGLLLWSGGVLAACTTGTPAVTAVSTSVAPAATPTDPATTAALPLAPSPQSEPSPVIASPSTPTSALPATATPVIAEAPALPTLPPAPPMETAVPTPSPTFAAYGITQTIGFSSNGYPIISHRFGYGAETVVFVGGIHGGYEWNTILLAYEAIDFLQENPDVIPANVTVYVIPSANPDGQRLVTGGAARFAPEDVRQPTDVGRFNGNGVDLNRNWDCNWSPTGQWGSREVSGGERPFSEPETQALRQFLLTQRAQAVIFWHSKANGVYAAGCAETYPPAYDLAMLYGTAAEYPIYEAFTAYPVSGDASDWLALQRIPAITVELKTRSELDWPQNLNGILAVLTRFGQSP